MPAITPAGELERFVGLFYRTNAKNPQPRPDSFRSHGLERLVVTKGMLQMVLSDGTVVGVNIEEADQVDDDTYKGYLTMLTDGIAGITQAPHLKADILSALKAHGLIAQAVGPVMHFNPLTPGDGEVGQLASL